MIGKQKGSKSNLKQAVSESTIARVLRFYWSLGGVRETTLGLGTRSLLPYGYGS